MIRDLDSDFVIEALARAEAEQEYTERQQKRNERTARRQSRGHDV